MNGPVEDPAYKMVEVPQAFISKSVKRTLALEDLTADQICYIMINRMGNPFKRKVIRDAFNALYTDTEIIDK